MSIKQYEKELLLFVIELYVFLFESRSRRSNRGGQSATWSVFPLNSNLCNVYCTMTDATHLNNALSEILAFDHGEDLGFSQTSDGRVELFDDVSMHQNRI